MKYYCNNPCTVLADLGDEALIEIVTHAHTYDSGDPFEPPHTEPEYNRLVVSKKYLTETKIDFEKEATKALAKAEQILREAQSKAKFIVMEAELDAAKVKADLRKRAEKFDKVSQLVDFLEGNFKWAVTECYSGVKIHKYEDLIADKHYSEIRLRAIVHSTIIKGQADSKVSLTLDHYWDGSGRDTTPVVGFRTEEEAVQYAKQRICHRAKDRLSGYDVETAQKYNMGIPEVTAYLAEKARREEENRKIEIGRLMKELEKLNG